MELLIPPLDLIALAASLLVSSIVGTWWAAPEIINALLVRKKKKEVVAWKRGRDSYFEFLKDNGGKEPLFKLSGTTNDEFQGAGWAKEQRDCYGMGTISRERFLELCEKGFDWKNRSDLKPAELFPEKEELDANKEYKPGVWHYVASITGCLLIDVAIVATAAFQPVPIALVWGAHWSTSVWLILYLCVLMSLYDWHCRIIPIELSLICALLSILYALNFYGLNGVLYGIGAAIVLTGFFLLMNFINTKRGKRVPMGGGDIALFVSVAIASGAAGPLGVLIAIIVWGISTVGYLMYGIARHKMTHASFIPAGPFITAGFLAGIIFPLWLSLF